MERMAIGADGTGGGRISRVKKHVPRRSQTWRPGRTIQLWASGTMAVIGVLTTGCGGDVDSGAETTAGPVMTRDSAGITIAEISDSVGGIVAWRIADQPILTIGDDLRAPPEYQFESIDDMIRLPTGGVLVADGASLREYAEDGTYVESWGQEGEGPGDFQFIGGLHRLRPDSVAVWDRFLHRLTVFDAKGNVGRTLAISEASQLILRGMTGRDRLVFERVVMMFEMDINALMETWDQREEYDRRSGFVEVWDARGNPVSIIGPYPHTEVFTRRDRNRHMGPVRYSRNMITGIWGSLVIAGPNDTFELRAHAPDGGLRRIIRLDREPVVSDDRHRELLPDDDRDIPMAANLPMFGQAMGDELGYLWVRDYKMPGEETVSWTVFDSTGAIATRLEMSARLTVHEIGRDYIVASSRVGELGIEAAMLLSLER